MPIMHPFPYFAGFEPANPYLPSFYAQADDLEQRIMYLCREYCKLIQFTDSMVDTLNDSYAVIQDMQEKLPGLIDDATAEEIGRLVESGQFQQMIQTELERFEQATKEEIEADITRIDNWIDTRQYINGVSDSTTIAAENITTIGTLELPEGHNLQSIVMYDNILYVGHHVNDDAPFFISRYEYPSLTPMDIESTRVVLPSGIHGNGMDININEGVLYLTDSLTRTLYMVPISPWGGAVKTQSFAGCHVSGIAIKRDGTKIALGIGGALQYEIFTDYSDSKIWITSFLSESAIFGNCFKQDMCGSDNFIYQLCSNQNSQKFNAQFILMVGFNGQIFKKVYLPNTEHELEGIQRNSDDGTFILVDVTGNVFEALPEAGQISSGSFGQLIGTYRRNPSCNWGNSDPTLIKSANTAINLVRDFKIPYLNAPQDGGYNNRAKFPITFLIGNRPYGAETLNAEPSARINTVLYYAPTLLFFCNYNAIANSDWLRLSMIAVFNMNGERIVYKAFNTGADQEAFEIEVEDLVSQLRNQNLLDKINTIRPYLGGTEFKPYNANLNFIKGYTA